MKQFMSFILSFTIMFTACLIFRYIFNNGEAIYQVQNWIFINYLWETIQFVLIISLSYFIVREENEPKDVLYCLVYRDNMFSNKYSIEKYHYYSSNIGMVKGTLLYVGTCEQCTAKLQDILSKQEELEINVSNLNSIY